MDIDVGIDVDADDDEFVSKLSTRIAEALGLVMELEPENCKELNVNFDKTGPGVAKLESLPQPFGVTP